MQPLSKLLESYSAKFPASELPGDPHRWMLEQEAQSYNEQAGAPDGYECRECGNKGMVAVIRDNGVVIVPCKCANTRETLRRAKNSGLSHLLSAYTFKAFRADTDWRRNALDMAKRYADNPQGWLYIGGQVGSGKTHLCTAVAGALLKKGMSVRYMLWRDEIAALKAGMMGEGESYMHQLDVLKTVDVLYIDDLYKGKISETDMSIAFELVNARYNARKPTIFSCEWFISELVKTDAAVGSRIAQMARGNTLEIGRDPAKCYRFEGVL